MSKRGRGLDAADRERTLALASQLGRLNDILGDIYHSGAAYLPHAVKTEAWQLRIAADHALFAAQNALGPDAPMIRAMPRPRRSRWRVCAWPGGPSATR